MAAPVVTADNARQGVLDDTTGIASIGGGAGAGTEPDFFYQGVASVSRKIGTTLAGFDFTAAGTIDMTVAKRTTVMLKVLATNKDALLAKSAPAMSVRVGNDSSNYYRFDLEGNNTYPVKGGWLIRPVNPNIASYRDATVGSPGLTTVDYYGITGDFSVASFAPNLALDAVDVGSGLNIVDGAGQDTKGDFDFFVNFDEGIVANRFGFVSTADGVLLVYGMLSIGRDTSDVAQVTEFVGALSTLVFPDGLFDVGFSGVLVDLRDSGTIVTFSRCAFFGRGDIFGVDTRPILTVIGTAGTFTMTSCVFVNFRSFTLTSATTLDKCTLTDSTILVHGGAALTECTFDAPAVTSGDPFITTTDLAPISDCSFTSGAVGHAIEITATGTFGFVGNLFSGYGANETLNSAIHNSSGGLVTINITGGGDTPTVRNTAGSTTIINNNTAVTLTGMQDNTEVRVYDTGTQTELAGIEDAIAGSPGNRSFTFSLGSGTFVDIRIHNVTCEPIALINFQIPTLDTSLPVQQRFDRNYENPP